MNIIDAHNACSTCSVLPHCLPATTATDIDHIEPVPSPPTDGDDATVPKLKPLFREKGESHLLSSDRIPYSDRVREGWALHLK